MPVLPLAAQWILAAAGLIAAGGVILRFARRLYRIDAALTVLLPIADEFRPNAGRSLFDRLESIDDCLGRLDVRLTETAQLLGRNTQRLDEIEQQLEER